MAAFPPVASVVFTEDDHEALGSVLVLQIFVSPAQGKLPAHLGLGFDEGDSFLIGEVVERAAVATSEPFGVVKDAGVVHDAGFGCSVFLLGPASLVTDVVVFPQLGRQLLDPTCDALVILLLGEVSTVNTAPRIGSGGINALAAATEDACPPGRQPGQIGPDQLVVVGGIDELDPLPRKVQGYLRHAGSLGDEGDVREGAGV